MKNLQTRGNSFRIKIKSTKEVLVQIPRLLIGGVKSFVGNILLGNTRGANIPPLKPLLIEQEIKDIFEKQVLQCIIKTCVLQRSQTS